MMDVARVYQFQIGVSDEIRAASAEAGEELSQRALQEEDNCWGYLAA